MADIRYSSQDINAFDKDFRRNFINCLSGFKSLNLCGTISLASQSNLSLLNSVMHIGANPPLMGMIMRPHVVERHTIENIQQTGAYTINMVAASFYPAAHQASARYPRAVSEFEAVGLTPLFQAPHLAPYVAEAPIKIGLSFAERHEIQANATQLIVGKIEEVFIDETAVREDGFIDLLALKAMAGGGLDGYYQVQSLKRLAYAKPDQPPRPLSE